MFSHSVLHHEELNSKIVEIKKLKAGLQCHKCDFQAYTGSTFIIHLSKEHSLVNEKILKCEKCDFSCTKEKELVNHISSEHVESVNFSCTKCDFISEKKFNVDLHISTIHQDNCNALSSFSTIKNVYMHFQIVFFFQCLMLNSLTIIIS